MSELSTGFFLAGILFVLLIGSCLSVGVLSFFQQKKKKGMLFLAGMVVSIVAMVLTMDAWFS